MSDTEILDAIERGDIRMEDVDQSVLGERRQWQWYDRRNAPNHKGWTDAESMRDALARLILSKK